MTQPSLLHVKANACADADTLASFDAASMGLIDLGGVVHQECWCGPSDQFSFVDIRLNDPIDQDPAPVVEEAYLALFSQAKEQGFPSALRIWQFIPGINEGSGDQERYRRFCVGRAEALRQLNLADHQMCAATAIGCHDETFRLVGLFGRIAGESIENPRQVSAWQYPREYGPVSPAFARATIASLNGRDASDGLGLMISGTAAVVGHASAHPNDVLAQTEEAMINVERILEEASATSSGGFLDWGQHTMVRVYLRNPNDWDSVCAAIHHRWPAVQLMGVQGDICRRELLVELEAWHPSQEVVE